MTYVATAVLYWWVPYGIALICHGVWVLRKYRRIRRMVFDNLDSARDNGYFAPGEYLFAMSTEEIAHDLSCFAQDCEGMKPATLKPHVIAWERARGFRNWEN